MSGQIPPTADNIRELIQPRPHKAMDIKYSLSNLLLLTALIAALMGWFYDHGRLSNDKQRLNLEAIDLFGRWTASHGSGAVLPPGQTPNTRAYNFSIEKDRADYVRDFTLPRYFPIGKDRIEILRGPPFDSGPVNSNPAK